MLEELEPEYPRQNHVWQFTRITGDPQSPATTTHTQYYSEIILAVPEGFLAKNAFIEATQKSRTRNLFLRHRAEVGNVIFAHHEPPKEVFYRDWMDRTEEDAKYELLEREIDPASTFDELIPNSLLKIK
jgi:hypothetical protein